MDTRMVIDLPYKFKPRTYQVGMFVAREEGITQMMLVQHRRSGKTEGGLALVSGEMFDRPGGYAHIFPILKQARESVWFGMNGQSQRYLDHFPAPLLERPPNNSDLAITYRNGSRYIMLGTDRNINAVVAMNPVGIIWDEFALQDPMARQLARPILLENGGWEVIVTTPRGENHAKSTFDFAESSPDWFTEYLPVTATYRDGPGESGAPVLTEAQVEQERRDAIAQGVPDADALIDQEYYLSWKSPMPGAYYAQALRRLRDDGRVTGVPHDPRKPVYTAWDLGTSQAHDTQSIWFYQLHGSRVCIIHYLQAANYGIDWYCQQLQALPYQYKAHYAQEYDLKEADWGTGKTRGEVAQALGVRFTPVPRLSMIEYINATRLVLARCYFDDSPEVLDPGGWMHGVGAGLNALSSFRREYDTHLRTYSNTPVHDWSSHGATAFHYLALSIEDPFATDEPLHEPRGRRVQGNGVGFNPLRR